jgi:hypothetical protein
MNNLADLVDRLAKSEVLAQSVEEATRQAAVLPVLDALGWDWRDLDEVAPEYVVRGGRVDYCLRTAGRTQVLVEVKRTGTDLDAHQEQLLRYAFEEGAPLAVLTDGLVWWLYLPTETGSWEQRKFFTIDFRRQSSDVAALSLSRFLTKSAVVDGQAIEEARAEHSGQERDRRVREGLPVAWRQLLAGPDELLSELLAEAVAGVSGHRPNSEQVAQFLAAVDSPTRNEATPTRVDVTQTPQGGPPVERLPESFLGRRPIAFTFQGERHPVETWRDILTGLSEIAAMHVGERFADVVQPIRGRKRTYFGKTSDGLVAPLPILGGKMFIEGNLDANKCVHIARRVAAAAFGDEVELTVEHSLRD